MTELVTEFTVSKDAKKCCGFGWWINHPLHIQPEVREWGLKKDGLVNMTEYIEDKNYIYNSFKLGGLFSPSH